MLRTGLHMLLVTLLSVLALKASPARQWQNHSRSAKPQPKRATRSEEVKVSIRAPCARPDGKQHDRLEDFDPDELKKVLPETAHEFLAKESAPDLAVMIFTLGAKEPDLIACTQNQYEVFFQMTITSEPYAFLVMDRDGDGQLRPGRYSDLIGTVIVATNGSPPTEQQRAQLSTQLIVGMRAWGVLSVEFAKQRSNGSQIPRHLSTINLKDCQATECHPNGKDGIALTFELVGVSALRRN